MQIKLHKPLTYHDAELDTLDIDLDGLTGNDMIDAESNVRRAYPGSPLYGARHIAAIASKASHIPAEVITGMNARDFLRLQGEIMDFFSPSSLEASQPDNSGN